MTADLPPHEFEPGRAIEVAPGVRRIVAPNPGRMTGRGTNTFLVGERSVLVVDPGPAIPAHVDAIVAALGTARVSGVLVTHTHRDHSPAARELGERYLAPLVGRRPRHEDYHDTTFVADEEPADGARYASDAGDLVAIPTPGHASNHVCWYHERTRALLTGDHVLGTVSPVILPPDGDMAEYLDSLARLQRLDLASILPGHGPVLRDPQAVLASLVAHRLGREAKVHAALDRDGRAVEELVPHVYDDVDPALHGYARFSLLAHLLKLERDGRARRDGPRWRAA